MAGVIYEWVIHEVEKDRIEGLTRWIDWPHTDPVDFLDAVDYIRRIRPLSTLTFVKRTIKVTEEPVTYAYVLEEVQEVPQYDD